MRFSPDIYDNEVEREFGRFFKWTGQDNWREKISKFEKSPRISEADVYRQYLWRRNPLLICVDRYLRLSRHGLRVAKHLDDECKRLCGYIKLLNRIVHESGQNVAKRLKGSVLDDESTKSFLFELEMAIHFFRQGYDVNFMDLSGQAQYDLLVTNGEHTLEIECKRKSVDAGRKIRRRDFYLCSEILFAALKDSNRRFTVSLRASGRLGANQELFRTVAETVNQLLRSDSTTARVGNLELTLEPLPEDVEVRNDREAHEAISQFHTSSAHYSVYSNQETTLS